ncbi:MAG: hypothetical protein RLY86_351 [Pseudomonadota bacterium]|jgi:hypothetical protein
MSRERMLRGICAGLLALVAGLAAHQIAGLAGVDSGFQQQLVALAVGIMVGMTYQQVVTGDRED